MDTVTDPPDAFESSYIRDSALRNTSGSTSMVGAAALATKLTNVVVLKKIIKLVVLKTNLNFRFPTSTY